MVVVMVATAAVTVLRRLMSALLFGNEVFGQRTDRVEPSPVRRVKEVLERREGVSAELWLAD